MSALLKRSVFALSICLALRSLPALASSAIVPDDFQLVQSAINSGVDTVRIRPGTYPERPLVDHAVVLEGIGAERPALDGLEITNFDFFQNPPLLSVQQLRFLGRVNHATNSVHPRSLVFSFTGCSLDSGFNQVVSLDPYDIESLTFRNCYLRQQSQARAAYVTMDRDTVEGTASWDTDGDVSITDCLFNGNGSATALEIPNEPGGQIIRNRIDNYTTGIAAFDMRSMVIANNLISRCGIGMRLSASDPAYVTDNDIRACAIGMFVGTGGTFYLRRNTVLGSSNHGIRARVTGMEAEDNVVGGSGGHGLLLEHVDSPRVRRNTLFRNGGSGIQVQSVDVGGLVVENNIAFENQAWGLSVPSGLAVTLKCNDWFNNALGAVSGATPDSTDLFVDPLFCDVDSSDVHLTSKSPLADVSACGRIGAREVGCGVTATLLDVFRVDRTGTAARIYWRFGSDDPGKTWLERAPEEAGPWKRLSVAARRERDGHALTDYDVEAGKTYWYRVAWQQDGTPALSAPIRFALEPATSQLSIVPDPSQGPVEVRWTQPLTADLDVSIYDIAGRKVAALTRGRHEPGNHSINWDRRREDGARVAAGTYFVRLKGSVNATRVLHLLR